MVSRPSSGWDRVGHKRYGHQAMKPVAREGCLGVKIDACTLVFLAVMQSHARISSADIGGVSSSSANRAISIG